jgi:hypothetical protein
MVFGAVYGTAVAVAGPPACPLPPGPARAIQPTAQPLVVAEKALTWAPTGLATAYAHLQHGNLCHSSAEGLLVARHQGAYFGRKSFTIGDVFLTRDRPEATEVKVLELLDHEKHHRRQWAIGTVLGGPIAFPLAYSIDDVFYPEARNHFEREAGLVRGGYEPTAQTGPKLRLQDLALLLGAAAGAELIGAVRRRRPRRVAGLLRRRS